MNQKVAMITGGTRGIGFGIAKAFLKEGYRVVLNYRSDEQTAQAAQEELGTNAFCVQADITKKEQRSELIEKVEEKWGRMDVLVNNAAIIRMGRSTDVTEEDFDAVMQCNLYAPIFLSQLFVNWLIENKAPGSIINILSIGAHGAGNISYCTSKAALLLATKCMARELAKHQIRVNSISPHGVATKLNQENRKNNPEAWEKLIEKIPMRREATTEEVAGAAVYLASDTASFTTGIDLPVDGGYLTR